MLQAAQHPNDACPAPTEELIGAYRLGDPVGAGAMGVVYRAHHIASGKEVAIKVLRERPGPRSVRVERLRREARAMGALDHPNIVQVHAFDEMPDGRSYMVMELVHGRTLASIIDDEGALPGPRVARLVGEIARGLDAAHRKGFVHRDLKPANVMVLDGQGPERIKLLDFGIVSGVTNLSSRLTHDGVALGTPAYMAPEQIMALPVDHRADLYALGVVAFELLTGLPPFDGSFREIAAQHVLSPPGPLPDCGRLALLTLRLLAKEPSDRPASALAVVAELNEMSAPPVGGRRLRATTARPAPRPLTVRSSAADRSFKRRRWGGGAALCAAIVISFFARSLAPVTPRGAISTRIVVVSALAGGAAQTSPASATPEPAAVGGARVALAP